MGGRPKGSPRGSREAAEARLADLREHLNPNGYELRTPAKGEIPDLLDECFARTIPGEHNSAEDRFARLGFAGYRPLPASKVSHWIVEAVHVRGYLRKLQAEVDGEKAAELDRDRQKHRRALDGYKAAAAAAQRDLEAVSEGYTRYAQFLADKAAYHRACDMRADLDRKRATAERAAEALDEELPAGPDMGDVGTLVELAQ